MLKIAFNNWIAGSGKDACADYLVEKHGFKKIALAEDIHGIAHNIYGVPEGERPKRDLLWHIGESLREYDIMVWINHTLRKIKADGHDRVVITDVRKVLEHAYLGELGWNNVMIYCDPKVAIKRLKERDGYVNEEAVMNNSLENQLRPLKETMRVFDNTDDFEETKKELDAYVNFLVDSSNKK